MVDGVNHLVSQTVGIQAEVRNVLLVHDFRWRLPGHDLLVLHADKFGSLPGDTHHRLGIDNRSREACGRNAGGTHDGHLDLALGLNAQGVRKKVHGGLAGPVNARTLHREVAVDGRNVHHVSAALHHHLVVHRGHAMQHTLDVDIDAARPGVHRIGMVCEKRERHGSRVVHHHVDGPKLGHRRLCHLLNFGVVRDVRWLRDRLTTSGLNRGDGLRQPLLVDVRADDFRAETRTLLADQLPETAARASHNNHSALDRLAHSSLLCALEGDDRTSS